MKSQFLEKTVSLLLRILTVRALLVNLEETHVELIEIVSFISTINFIGVKSGTVLLKQSSTVGQTNYLVIFKYQI